MVMIHFFLRAYSHARDCQENNGTENKGSLRALTALTLSYATTPGARKSGRLRKVVVQGKNQENMLKLN